MTDAGADRLALLLAQIDRQLSEIVHLEDPLYTAALTGLSQFARGVITALAPSDADAAKRLKSIEDLLVSHGAAERVSEATTATMTLDVKREPMRTTLQPHSTDELRRMAEHVGYEVQQMGDATRLIRAGEFPVDSPTTRLVVGNALLESVLIHIRSLDDFFARTASTRPDDVLAVHYLPSWSPTPLLTKSQREKVSKSLAHLTTARAAGPVSWPLDLADDALVVFRSFAADLRESFPLRFAWFNIELR